MMAIGIFRRPYTIRRHGEQKIINGYSTSGYTDIIVRLNVQPLSANELKALPEGERTVKRVKTFGADALISADEQTQTPGDLLFYGGAWYVCTSCVHWLHTPLAHYESQFVALADQKPHNPPKSASAANNGGGLP